MLPNGYGFMALKFIDWTLYLVIFWTML